MPLNQILDTVASLFYKNPALHRLSKRKGRDASPRGPILAAEPPVSPRRRFAPEVWVRWASQPCCENSPENRHSVIGCKSIAGDQIHFLDPRLGYEQPVKRIPVVEG